MPDAELATFAASDGYCWKYRRYQPATSATSIVVLHGIQSHGGWYVQSCGALADAGHTVSMLDRRGSGMNERDRGDAPSFRRLLDDVAEFVAVQSPPVILVGISWGGKLAAALLRRKPTLIDGLVLVAPGIRQRVRPRLVEKLRIVLSRLRSPERHFPIPLNDPALFTANPERQKLISDDPLALREASARLLVESARLDFYLRSAVKRVNVPTLLLLAQHDRIIDNDATRKWLDKLPTTDKAVIEYARAHHTLEFEPDGPPFIDDLTKWLARFAKRS